MDIRTYKDAGVDIKRGERLVESIRTLAKKTQSPEVISGIGGFAGLFALGGYKDPVLVSGTDGVGTKLEVAIKYNKHDTIGIDLVAMCVNDILVQGAKPLFFLDYLATGAIEGYLEDVIKGIVEGCLQAGCTLLGGETAEMPGFYSKGFYDLAGFAVGVVERDKIVDGLGIRADDVLVGIPSSGLHSNGYSLARSVLLGPKGFSLDLYIDELGARLGDELLKPTRIYVSMVQKLLESVEIKGMAHITGGGLKSNTLRVIPQGLNIEIDYESFARPGIFKLIQDTGGIAEEEMRKVFNLGIGYVLIVSEAGIENLFKELDSMGEKAYIIGKVIKER